MGETTPELFLAGQQAVELAGRQLGMPVVFTAVERELLDQMAGQLAPDMPVLPLERFFVMPWA